MFIHVFICLIIRSFDRSFFCSFVRSFVRSFTYSFVRLFVCSFVRSFVYLFIQCRCAMPAEVAGWNVLNVTSTMNCESEKSVGAITIGVIVVLVCTIAILFAVISIIKKRRAARKQPRNVKYSEVYRDPTERRA